MSKVLKHPLEGAAERVITDLGGDLAKIRAVFDTGSLFRAEFAGAPFCISLPTYVPTASNVFRIEFTVGEVDVNDVARVLFAIGIDMDTHRHSALRVIPRAKDQRTYQIILQSVCEVDLVQEGFMAATVLYAADLCELYRTEFLNQSKAA